MSIEHRKNKWVARIQIDNERIYLGTYKLKRDAVQAYEYAKAVVKAEKEFHQSLQQSAELLYQSDELLEEVKQPTFWSKLRSYFQ